MQLLPDYKPTELFISFVKEMYKSEIFSHLYIYRICQPVFLVSRRHTICW